MNCIETFALKSLEFSKQMAFVSPNSSVSTFGDLRQKVMQVQKTLLQKKLKKGDSVLVAFGPSVELYALVIAVMGLGASVVLVEPWMPIKKIAEVVALVRPKIFVSTIIGSLWGLRVSEIRRIDSWMRPQDLFSHGGNELIQESVDEHTAGIITFTSGTSGIPKGVVREQGYLIKQFEVLKNSLHLDQHQGSDLCIFANWTLLNLAQGKSTVFFPADWSNKNFKWLSMAAKTFQIETLTSGPSFIKSMSQHMVLSQMKEMHIGGALTSCELLEDLIKKYQSTQIFQVYGSSEVEPVSVVDARISLLKSKAKNYYHALYLGKAIDEISYENKKDGLWVTGPHVCPFYLNNKRDNELNKRRDEQGRIWHFMGDRIDIDSDEQWWYGGRSQSESIDFYREQELYLFLGHEDAFLERNEKDKIILRGEKLFEKNVLLKEKFPFIKEIVETKIKRDKRHRARIDRVSSAESSRLWSKK